MAINEIALLIALTVSGIWLGSILFLSAVLAPMVFKALSAEHASQFLRMLFPRYYITGIVLTIIISIAILADIFSASEIAGTVYYAAFANGVVLAMAIYSLLLVPKINAARDAGEKMAAIFEKLHLRSVIINVFMLLLTIAVFICLALALQP